MNKTSDKEKMIMILIISLFWIYLYYNIPIGHDDWTWGSNIGIERLQSMFANYNGRYFGGILTIVLTRSILARLIIMTSITVAIIFFISNNVFINSNISNKKLLILSFILAISTPRDIFRQTFSWISGFSNYVPPVLLTLVYISIIKSVFSDKRTEKYENIYGIIGVFCLAIAMQLFIEHVTLYFIFINILILIYSYCRFKKIYKADIAMVIGALIGAIIMFSNGAYHNIAKQEDTYRTMASGGIIGIIKDGVKQYINIINPQFFMNLIILSSILSILCIVLMVKYTQRKKDIGIILKAVTIVVSIYPIYLIYTKYYTTFLFSNELTIKLLEGLLSILYYISISIILIATIESKKVMHYSIFLLGSSITLLGPLMIVTPIGGRNFLSSYIFLAMLVIQLIVYLKLNLENSIATIGIYAINSLLVIAMLVVFTSIGIDGRNRVEVIESQIKEHKNIIYVPKIRCGQYLQGANPKFGDGYGGEYGFRAYYGLDKDIQIKLENEKR